VAYGFLFGVFPSITTDLFGEESMSQNWGTMTTAPGLFGPLFNLIYGRIYDSNSFISPNGHRICEHGKACYTGAYWVTFGASCVGLALALWSIHHQQRRRDKQ
jgi:MFS family permease